MATAVHVTVLSRVRGSMTNNNRFWIGLLNLLAIVLQFQLIKTAHNQWLPKTRSISYWTTSGERLDSDLGIGQFFSFRCLLLDTSQLNTELLLRMHPWSLWRINQFTNELSFITWGEQTWDHRLEQWIAILHCNGNVCFVLLYLLQRKCVLASRCLANGLQLVRCYFCFQEVFTEPLPSSVHICHIISDTTDSTQGPTWSGKRQVLVLLFSYLDKEARN
jgi:hypothetical protein